MANHRAKLLLPGVAGADDGVPGHDARPRRRPTATGEDDEFEADVAPGEGDAAEALTGLGTELARGLPANEAILLVDDQEPLRTRLRPWFRSRTLRRRAGAAQDALLVDDSIAVEALSPFGGPALGDGDDDAASRPPASWARARRPPPTTWPSSTPTGRGGAGPRRPTRPRAPGAGPRRGSAGGAEALDADALGRHAEAHEQVAGGVGEPGRAAHVGDGVGDAGRAPGRRR